MRKPIAEVVISNELFKPSKEPYKVINIKDIAIALDRPQTIVVSDELYEVVKEYYKDFKHTTIMCASEMLLEKELILENYYCGEGVSLEPKLFNPRSSFEHIRKKK